MDDKKLMTDQEAMNTIDAYLPRHCRAALDHIAARLRGEAAPAPVAGEAVTTPATPLTLRGLVAYGRVAAMPWQGAKPDHMRDLIGQMVPHLLQLEAALSAAPAAPAPVAGDAVAVDDAMVERLSREVYEVHCNTPIGHFPNDSHLPKWRAVVQHVIAALAQDRAAQSAAPAPCAFRALLAEARRKYRDSDAAGDVLAWLDEQVLETDYAAPQPGAAP